MAKKKPTPKTKSNASIVAESADLHEVFRAIVDHSGQSRYALAQTLGVGQSTLSRAYTGAGGVPWELLQSVAKVTGVRVVAKADAT